jgi:RNA polymerase sigma-70 factor (ECF subfamily)
LGTSLELSWTVDLGIHAIFVKPPRVNLHIYWLGGANAMTSDDAEEGELLRRAKEGDHAASNELLARHRLRLRRMVALRMDRRLASRVDASDIVQEALAEASRNLDDYLERQPMPFYPWLRRLAWERMVAMSRRHVGADRRSVVRETPWSASLPDESVMELAGRLASSGTSPSAQMRREEIQQRMHSALAMLAEHDREVLVLRYLEQLSTKEAAAVLGFSEGGVKSRLMRAIMRLRELLENDASELRP